MSKKSALDLLNPMEQDWLVEKIREAEQYTTGEIRVHLEDYSLENPLDRATEVFAELQMQNTRYRNGVLIYIAATQHQFCIIGDMGINNVVGDAFWQEQTNILCAKFKRENYYEGIIRVIKNVGKVLREHFPVGGDSNPDELSNEISFG